jgi:2-oxoglutarate ferredoxin oxidoreductase subunit gamma
MNRPSLEKFAPMVKPGGVVLINSSLIPIGTNRDDIDELKVPATDIAKKLGNVRSANIVALSAFVARSRIIEFEGLREAVKAEFAYKKELIPLNMNAVDEGKKTALTQ